MQIDSISATGITKRYGRERALASVSFELERGSICALLGANGAGKSTLLGILSTLVRPTSGEVDYLAGGTAVAHDSTLRGQIGVLAHDSFVYAQLTAIENLRFFGELYRVKAIDERVELLLARVGLERAAWTRAAGTYSRGMLQRLAVARALLADPGVLLLDEPFTGLDRGGAETLTEALASARADRRVVVVVTHDLDPIDGLTDHVVILRRGKIAREMRRKTPFSADELKAAYAAHSE